MSREFQRAEEAIKRAVIRRDEGCVWCKLHYRDEEHIKIPIYHVEVLKGKKYAVCEFHWAEFKNIKNLPKCIEMYRALTRYLMTAPDPETRVL